MTRWSLIMMAVLAGCGSAETATTTSSGGAGGETTSSGGTSSTGDGGAGGTTGSGGAGLGGAGGTCLPGTAPAMTIVEALAFSNQKALVGTTTPSWVIARVPRETPGELRSIKLLAEDSLATIGGQDVPCSLQGTFDFAFATFVKGQAVDPSLWQHVQVTLDIPPTQGGGLNDVEVPVPVESLPKSGDLLVALPLGGGLCVEILNDVPLEVGSPWAWTTTSLDEAALFNQKPYAVSAFLLSDVYVPSACGHFEGGASALCPITSVQSITGVEDGERMGRIVLDGPAEVVGWSVELGNKGTYVPPSELLEIEWFIIDAATPLGVIDAAELIGMSVPITQAFRTYSGVQVVVPAFVAVPAGKRLVVAHVQHVYETTTTATAACKVASSSLSYRGVVDGAGKLTWTTLQSEAIPYEVAIGAVVEDAAP